MLVVTESWDAPAGTIEVFTRVAGSGWVPSIPQARAVVGRSGLGWGVGLHGGGAPDGRSGPLKREGDGRAPAGVFTLGDAFGYSDAAPDGTRVPYTRSTDSWVCVDDVESASYNRVLDTTASRGDWNSAERMLRTDPLYARLLLVGHNGLGHTSSAPQPGRGSCIFMHVWRSPDRGTDGCFATTLEGVEAVIGAVEPGRAVLVALPRSELEALRTVWRLP